MVEWRRFEKDTASWQIRVAGIRCFLRWGRVDGQGSASTTILDDGKHALAHAKKKIAAQLRKGYVEVAAVVEPDPDDPAALVVGTIAARTRTGLPPLEVARRSRSRSGRRPTTRDRSRPSSKPW
jgi:predicted DNA-binding WGR domain protein